MASNRNGYLHDPLNGGGQINEMPSGLVHLADSMDTIKGEYRLTFGAPGDPREKSQVKTSNLIGKSPNIQHKFMKGSQR